MNTKPKLKLSSISAMHYFKLVFRSLLLLAATGIYIYNSLNHADRPFGSVASRPIILVIIWLVFAAEMVLRFFPSRLESMGCQKQFKQTFVPVTEPSKRPVIPQSSDQSTAVVAAAWVTLNALIGALYLAGVIDAGIMLLISLAFSVCDMVCILFFCPFQTWFMKNKCCGSCRIYNWDFAMMFTPLIFVPGVYTWSLLAMALALLIKWEVVFSRHPERFSETTNAALTCKSCPEKLCQHKVQLQHFLKLRWEQLGGNIAVESIRATVDAGASVITSAATTSAKVLFPAALEKPENQNNSL